MSDLERETDELELELTRARRTDKRQKWWLFALAMIALALAAVVGVMLVNAWAENEGERRATANAELEKKEIAQEAQQALCGSDGREIFDREICEKWAEIADRPVDVPALEGVSQEEIVIAFRAYCAAGNCRGADGRPPTPEEVAAAFARFCAGGACRGEPGEDGTDATPAPPGRDGQDGQDGVDGKDGLAADPPTLELMLAAVTDYCDDGRCRGEPGPGPTPEAIAAAVANQCANDACRGLPGNDGQPGRDGADGAPGRGVLSIQCDSPTPFSFTVTYSDGTAETTQCGGLAAPPPGSPPGQQPGLTIEAP